MERIMIRENLSGKKLKDLLFFVASISEKISLTRYDYHGKMTLDEFNQMQMEIKTSLLDDIKQMRLNYIENIDGYRNDLQKTRSINTKEEADKYFDLILENNIKHIVNSYKYEDFMSEKAKRYNKITPDFLYSRITRCTPLNIGPACEICYFKFGDIFNRIITNISELFERPYYDEESKFEDLTTYKGERIVLAIHSHEKYAFMNLEEEEYKEFSKLGILS